MTIFYSALDIIRWLETAIDDVQGVKLVKERYNMAKSVWINIYRPDCIIETAYAFLKAWAYTGDVAYLETSRSLYAGALTLQHDDGSFPYHANATKAYTNDNSEIAIYLLRMAEIDKAYEYEYRSKALGIVDWLIDIQNEDGSWRRSSEDSTKSPCFTAHAISALSTAYKFTTRRTAYRASIENGLRYISGEIREDGAVTLIGEAQRPPSSDQSICIRGFAHAELYVEDLEYRETWNKDRQNMLSYLNAHVTEEGSVKNGMGDGRNIADTVNVTDFVYTIPFAIEAFYFSSRADRNLEHFKTALRILRFAQSKIYYSPDDVCGVLRGAFNITERSWDTSDAGLDSAMQGGSDMLYTGWTNAPIAALLFTFAEAMADGVMLAVRIDDVVERFSTNTDGQLKVRIHDNIIRFPIVYGVSTRSSSIKLRVDGRTATLAYPL